MIRKLKGSNGYEASTDCVKKRNENCTRRVSPKSEGSGKGNLMLKPPTKSGETMHLPPIYSSLVREKKPRFFIRTPVSRRSIESSIGQVISSLTQNSLNKSHIIARRLSIDDLVSTEGCETLTDIEKIFCDQKYLNIKTQSKDQQDLKEEPKSASLVLTGTLCEKLNQRLTRTRATPHQHVLEETKTGVSSGLHSNIPQKTIIVPDIPKTAFGVHNSYHEIDLKKDFRILQCEELSNNPKPKHKSLSLIKDEELRQRILTEIMLEKKPNNDEEEDED